MVHVQQNGQSQFIECEEMKAICRVKQSQQLRFYHDENRTVTLQALQDTISFPLLSFHDFLCVLPTPST